MDMQRIRLKVFEKIEFFLDYLYKKAKEFDYDKILKFFDTPKIRYFLYFFGLILVLSIGIYFLKQDPSKFFKTGLEDTSPMIQVNDALLIGRNSGEKSWEFQAKTIYLTADSKKTIFKDVDGFLFHKNKPYIKIEAQEVELDMINKDFVAIGEIMLSTIDKKQVIYTDNLKWSSRRELLTSRGVIRVVMDDVELYSRVLDINLRKGEINLEEIMMEPPE